MFLLVCGRTTRFPPCPAAIVYPSGADFATKSRPSMPLAPGRFSTSTGWPSRSVIFGPIRRDMMSVVLPGGNGTTILIGLEGQDCASAAAANPRANAASANTRSRLILALPSHNAVDLYEQRFHRAFRASPDCVVAASCAPRL